MNRAREEKERLKGFLERGAPLPSDGRVKDSSQMETSKPKRPGTSQGLAQRKSPRQNNAPAQ